MQIRHITTTDELAHLLPDWNRLAGSPLTGPAWLLTWWRHFGKVLTLKIPAAQLSVLSVTDKGRVVAIAPWYVEPSLLHGRVLRFLGSGEVCSDYMTIPCEPGYEGRAIAAIARWLAENRRLAESRTPDGSGERQQRSWDMIQLTGVDAQDATMRLLIDELAGRGMITHAHAPHRCWRLDLPGSWEAYLALLSKSHRKRVRRLQRTYFDSGRARMIAAATPAQLEAGFRILTDLHALRWSARGQDGVFQNTTTHEFHRQATRELFAAGQLRLSWLELNGLPVAAEYALVQDGIIYAYQSGMDPAAAEHEPGSLSMIATLQGAISEGYRAIDFMRGDEPYKQHWRATERDCLELRVMPGEWDSRLRHTLWQAASSAKDWLRTARDLVDSGATAFSLRRC